jgi:DNA gyrase subunit B
MQSIRWSSEREEFFAAMRLKVSPFLESADHRGIVNLLDYCLDYACRPTGEGGRGARAVVIEVSPDGTLAISDDGVPWQINEASPADSQMLTDFIAMYVGGRGYAGQDLYIVNAMSEWLQIVTTHAGRCWLQEFQGSVPVGYPRAIGAANRICTTVRFRPSPDVFSEMLTFEDLKQACDTIFVKKYGVTKIRIKQSYQDEFPNG